MVRKPPSEADRDRNLSAAAQTSFGLAAIVLAGGAARRLGGAPKPTLTVGGRPLLLRVLDAVVDADPTIVVGPGGLAPLLPPGAALIQEEPAGGGPVAGLAAGARLVPAGNALVAVLAADLPFLTATVLHGLCAHLAEGGEVAVLLDGAGRPQWLCSVWQRPALMQRLAALGDPTGARMSNVVRGAAVRLIAAEESGAPSWFDCDTADDLRRANELA
jgi:molybdopterin-guanine dinucleotide biosynthesis protein A